MKKLTSRPYGGETGSIQAEEIDTGLTAQRNVGAYIELRKPGQTGNRRQPARMDPAHVKRNHPDPAPAIENVERKLNRHNGSQHPWFNRPVCKQEIVPGLSHDPRPGGQGPRPVRNGIKSGVHSRSVRGPKAPKLWSAHLMWQVARPRFSRYCW